VNIRLLYFASFRDARGLDEEVRSVPQGTTVKDLWEELRVANAHFARFSRMPAAAVNCEYVPASRALAEDDEVAFLPPVAGG
jgi:molybdopterin converting factor subunit 1